MKTVLFALTLALTSSAALAQSAPTSRSAGQIAWGNAAAACVESDAHKANGCYVTTIGEAARTVGVAVPEGKRADALTIYCPEDTPAARETTKVCKQKAAEAGQPKRWSAAK